MTYPSSRAFQFSHSRPTSHYPPPPPPPYQSLIRNLSNRYPVLKCLNEFLGAGLSASLKPTRAAVLEFREYQVSRIDFNDDEAERGESKLRRYLDLEKGAQHRLFILEDLHPSFVEVLGNYLNIDGTVFAHQIYDAHWSDGEYNDIPNLPSCIVPEDGFTVRYYEARSLDPFSELPELSVSSKTVGNVKRVVFHGTHEEKVEVERGKKIERPFVGLIRRNTSFWSQTLDDGSWNAVILVDPPSSLICEVPITSTSSGQNVKGSRKVHVENWAFQGGFRDFIEWPKTPKENCDRTGPSRESFLDDICSYWTTIASPGERKSAIKRPFKAATYQLQMVASVWMNTMSDVHAILSRGEASLYRLERMLPEHLSDAKRDVYLADLTQELNTQNTLRRRLAWYVSEMEINLLSLGISILNPSPRPDSHEKDFLFIYNKLLAYRTWAERLMDVINNHVNLMETEKTISDSKSLSRLTILGFFFVPIGFVASFFSMGGDFAVGESRFWIFWVTASIVVGMSCIVGFWKYWSVRWRTNRKLLV